MANNVIGLVSGGRPETLEDVETAQDVFDALDLEGNYTVTVKGKPASMDTQLSDYDQVKFTESVKGGC